MQAPSDRPIQFGIVGCGAIGPTHAGAIRQIEDARLVAVADKVPERAMEMAAKFEVAAHTDIDSLLNDPNIDAVCICTPSGMHADHAIRAMKAGKHVIIEKPMEITLDACDRMLAVQRETKKILAVVSQHRFDSATQLVKDLIDTHQLGKLVLITADVKWWRTQAYYDSGDWRGTWALDGGGALMNQGVHTVDLMRWLAGPVETIFAHTRTAAHERIEVEDVAVAALTFTSGAVGTLVATTAAYDGMPVRIDVFGTLGSATIEGDRLKQVTLTNGQKFGDEQSAAHAIRVARGGTASVKDDAVDRSAIPEVGAVWGDAHREQLRDFIRAIRTNTAPLLDGAGGRAAVELVLGVYRSAKEGLAIQL